MFLQIFLMHFRDFFILHCTRLNWMFRNWGCGVKKYAGLEYIHTWEPVVTIECKIQARQLLGPQTIWEFSLYFQSLAFFHFFGSTGRRWNTKLGTRLETSNGNCFVNYSGFCNMCTSCFQPNKYLEKEFYVLSMFTIWTSVLEINTDMLTVERDKG